jgi:hypothetical protein
VKWFAVPTSYHRYVPAPPLVEKARSETRTSDLQV